MANTTGKKFGGRQKGTLNKNKAKLADRLREKFPDFCPIEKMCEIAIDEKQEPPLRLQACKEIAQYIHPKLKAIEHSGANGGNIIIETVQFSTKK